MYAIFETGGKQYKASVGDYLLVDKLPAEVDSTVTFDKVLVVGGENTKFGAPFVDNATVVGKVINQKKSKKIIVFKYKPKSTYRKKQGHRQPYTKILIESIND